MNEIRVKCDFCLKVIDASDRKGTGYSCIQLPAGSEGLDVCRTCQYRVLYLWIQSRGKPLLRDCMHCSSTGRVREKIPFSGGGYGGRPEYRWATCLQCCNLVRT